MITKEQALQLKNGNEVHYDQCIKFVGPRGGVKIKQTRARVNGKCQTWKSRPNDFRVPIKCGMYAYGYITQLNQHKFHLEEDCPLNKNETETNKTRKN